jgi:hypothetical protein
MQISALLVSVVALFTPILATAQEPRLRSMLMPDQSDMREPEKLNEVFDPLFTTKKQGMGIDLSIAHTII